MSLMHLQLVSLAISCSSDAWNFAHAQAVTKSPVIIMAIHYWRKHFETIEPNSLKAYLPAYPLTQVSETVNKSQQAHAATSSPMFFVSDVWIIVLVNFCIDWACHSESFNTLLAIQLPATANSSHELCVHTSSCGPQIVSYPSYRNRVPVRQPWLMW